MLTMTLTVEPRYLSSPDIGRCARVARAWHTATLDPRYATQLVDDL